VSLQLVSLECSYSLDVNENKTLRRHVLITAHLAYCKYTRTSVQSSSTTQLPQHYISGNSYVSLQPYRILIYPTPATQKNYCTIGSFLYLGKLRVLLIDLVFQDFCLYWRAAELGDVPLHSARGTDLIFPTILRSVTRLSTVGTDH